MPLQGVHAVLVHGAWQGGWVWTGFAPLWAARGAVVQAVDLPGARGERHDVSFDEQLHAVLAHLDAVPAAAPLVLVGHSGGATVAAQAAEQRATRLAALVMIAGILPPSGGTLGDVLAELVAEGHDAAALAGIRPHLQWDAAAQVSSVPPAAAVQVFLHDCAPELAQAAAARLVPQSEAARAGRPSIMAQRFGRVPLIYVLAAQDRSIAPPAQRRMAGRWPQAQVLEIDAGHAPQVSAPARLDALLAAPVADAVARWRAAVGR